MDLSKLEHLFIEAQKLCGHHEYVVIGSLSALAILPAGRIPARMLMSIDVDCYTRRDPARIFELQHDLGEGSAFEAAHGYFLDPVSPKLPTLPAQWEFRLVKVPFTSGVTVFFLDPNDAAISKYARSETRDREWIQAGIAAGLLSLPIIESRLRDTEFIDDEERERARSAFAEDKSRL
ncbi:MAG: hypothetical protein A3H35_00980 [Betaproteobacteria bacterium RIFCSPLOWO2_02_FULL_62_17]|nr:MAG: hypothetical protein A3H35_00980 [Betaproteobacteria bacterium RIFCSPLOWO2_02_FULL_62_17]